MKEFCKWLGVNEKIAKIVVWLFIGMVFLIVTNIMLESIGFPYYKLTVDNLSSLNYSKMLDYILSWILTLLSFYSIIFLVFRIKEFKSIFKYSILYLVINYFGRLLTNSGINQIIIFIYIIGFCYFYSKKNWKYIFYSVVSLLLNSFVQYICYLYKARFIDFNKLDYLNRFLTSFDYFIIIGIIILIKEIIVKNKENKIKE